MGSVVFLLWLLCVLKVYCCGCCKGLCNKVIECMCEVMEVNGFDLVENMLELVLG